MSGHMSGNGTPSEIIAGDIGAGHHNQPGLVPQTIKELYDPAPHFRISTREETPAKP
jgi:hypothetical protein